MKREIKFRGFIGGQMRPVSIINNYKYCALAESLDFETMTADVRLCDDVPVMQYTGLKDKNGVEIYEGDIIKNSLTFVKGQIVDKDKPIYKTYIVDWHNGHTLGYRIKNRHNIMPLSRNKVFNAQSEVIGNIYENPELLTP